METLAYIVQHDLGVFITGHGKTYTIGVTVSRHMATSAGITDVAELTQLNF
jgi:hypothetical protein